MKDCALLVIDVQNDYLPEGAFPLEGSVEAAKNAAKMQGYFRSKNMPVYIIDHESLQEGATFFIPGSDGQKVADFVNPQETDVCIRKHFPNSFKDTSLLEDLQARGIKKLVITGMMTFMCVDATTRAACDLGFTCTLIHDATAARPLSFGDNDVAAADVQTAFIAALGFICDEVVSSDDFLVEK